LVYRSPSKPPTLWPPDGTTEPQNTLIKDVGATLWGMYYNVEAWSAAFELYKYSKAPEGRRAHGDVARKWKFIAAGECVMQVAYMSERLRWINSEKINACPLVAPHVDHGALRLARNLFNSYFPHIDKMRVPEAHTGAVDTNFRDHAPPGGWAFSRVTDEDRFEVTYEGEILHLDITDETLERLTRVTETFFRAFAAAGAALDG